MCKSRSRFTPLSYANNTIAKIEKVRIQGIRSFHPSAAQILAFNTPLTLIVGYNGSGKTTVIESLKYATTGEQPPNSKGGAFIHDPKIIGEREVMAQVKLSFRSIVGEELVITRSLQATQKKSAKTVTMKTLDGSLVSKNGSDRHGLSTRVAELDELVPQKLGVSPAILDNVIFCHQDESLWPLSEPSSLKKKFDEIFEAMKYTKAIDNLKQVRKKQKEALGKAVLLETVHKDAKEKGERTAKIMDKIEAEIENLRLDSEQYAAEITLSHEQLNEKKQQTNSFLNIVGELRNAEKQFAYRQDNAAKLRKGFEEMSESDQWLQDTLDKYEQRLQGLKDDMQQKTLQYRELQSALAASQNDLNAKHSEQGKLQSDKEKYERQLIKRSGMVREAAGRHEIRGYDGDLSDGDIRAFTARLEKILADKRRELERLKRDNGKELDQATGTITDLETRKAARTHSRVSAKQHIDKIERDSMKLQSEIQGLDSDEGTLAVLQADFDAVNTNLQKAVQEFSASTIDSQLQEETNRELQLNAENKQLGSEIVASSRFATERAQLDLRKKELIEHQRKLDTLTGTWNEKLSGIVGGPWQAESVEADYIAVLRQQAAQVKDAKRHVDTAQTELKQIEFSISTKRESQKKMAAESTRCQNAVLRVVKAVKATESTSMEDYPEELEAIEETLLAVEADIQLYGHLKDYYTKAETALNKHNKCFLCDRGFPDQSGRERSRLMEKIAKKLDDKDKIELEKDKREHEASLGKLRAVRSEHETYRRLELELPTLKTEIRSLEAQKDDLIRQLEDKDLVFKEANEKQQDTESMNKAVSEISRSFKDIANMEKQIDRLASQQHHSGPARSIDDAEKLQATCQAQLEETRDKIKKLRDEKLRKKEHMGDLELEKSELRNKIAHSRMQGEKKSDILRHVQNKKDDLSHERDSIRKIDEELQALEPEIAKARSIRGDIVHRAQGKEQTLSRDRDAVADTASELKLIENDIQNYLDSGGAANLDANQRSIQGLQQTISRTEKEVSDLTGQVNSIRTEVSNSDRQKKNIQDNISYREILRDLEMLKREIDELRARNATEDAERLQTEVRLLEDKHSKLQAKRGTILGSMASKDQEFGRLKQEWEQDYEGAEEQYRETHIRVETTKAAISDLQQYESALDKAIMQYHTLKMEEVNRIAGELWQGTYQGTDIDTILIKADTEGAAGKERRTYNYRVCMVKKDAEMDMRGRCSAGQKVLASIIIRLALAESFGVNCGLIALDEPTTNLDVDNIRSLADSLHSIIQARQAQANFQLIVITHDEDFLRHMRCTDFCDTFYRVERDESQNSVIKKESITRLIEG